MGTTKVRSILIHCLRGECSSNVPGEIVGHPECWASFIKINRKGKCLSFNEANWNEIAIQQRVNAHEIYRRIFKDHEYYPGKVSSK